MGEEELRDPFAEEVEKEAPVEPDKYVPKTEYGKKLLEEFKLYYGSSEEGATFKKFRTYQEAAETVLPDNYDIYISYSPRYVGKPGYNHQELTMALVLHFPELKMSDSTNHHTIYDMYVQYYNGRMTGKRTSFTVQELQQGYGHSHLSGGCNLGGRPSHFCLGSGPINDTLSRINNSRVTVDQVIYYILELKTYLKWQSNSGGPYQYFTNIPKHIVYGNNRIDYSRKPLESYLTIEDLDLSDPFNVKLKEDVLVVDDSNTSKEKMLSVYTKSYRPIWFRGKEVPLKIINEDEIEVKNKNNLRNLTLYERNSANSKVSSFYKEAIEKRYIRQEVQINTFL